MNISAINKKVPLVNSIMKSIMLAVAKLNLSSLSDYENRYWKYKLNGYLEELGELDCYIEDNGMVSHPLFVGEELYFLLLEPNQGEFTKIMFFTDNPEQATPIERGHQCGLS